jgi:peptide/nickel transport system permease protein
MAGLDGPPMAPALGDGGGHPGSPTRLLLRSASVDEAPTGDAPRAADGFASVPGWASSVCRERWAQLAAVLRRTLRSRFAPLSMVVALVFVGSALGAGLITPYDPLHQDYAAVLEAPSWYHPFGTDDLGRDVLSRVIHGSRVSLEAGVAAVAFAAVAGVALGLTAGYTGGLTDELLMRLTDALWSFPALLLALAITAALGPSLTNVIVAVGIVFTPVFGRLVRAQTLSVKALEFVTAARASGAGPWRIVRVHVWPNVAAPVIVQASLTIAYGIIYEATLSFLGVGVRPPTPSWGSMLRTGYSYLEGAPWLALAPGGAIFLSILAFNFLGDGLREALDPRLRQPGDS